MNHKKEMGLVTICTNEYLDKLERELAEAREEIERLKDHCRTKVSALQNQTSDTLKARQQRDRLAEALREVIYSDKLNKGNGLGVGTRMKAKQALAAVEGGGK